MPSVIYYENTNINYKQDNILVDNGQHMMFRGIDVTELDKYIFEFPGFVLFLLFIIVYYCFSPFFFFRINLY